MADITRKQLANAVLRAGRVTLDGCASDADDNAYGALLYPEAVADLIWTNLTVGQESHGWPTAQALRAPVSTDRELSALARILAELDGLEGGDASVLRSSAVQRVLTYVLDRHGYAIAGADE